MTPTASRYRYLQSEDIRKLARFEFAPRAVVDGYLAGRHRSRACGSSIEFRDYRQFVEGDDPAHIDWRVFGRSDRFYLRTFEQETNAEGHVLLDSSASMGFGARLTKLEYASFFCAALCYLIVRSTDRVSLQIFDQGTRHFFPPGSTQAHLSSLMTALENNHPGGRTSLPEALQRALPLIKRKGSLIILSDFFDDAAAIFEALNPFIHRGFRIHLFHILTPEELDLDDRGLAAFVDMETGRRVVAHTDNLRAAYRAAIQAHIANLRSLAVRRRIDYTLARTDLHYFALFDQLTR